MMSLSSSIVSGPRSRRPERLVVLGLVTLAATALAGCSSGSAGAATASLSSVVPSGSAPAAPAVTKPSLTVTLKVTSAEGARAVAVSADIRGNVPQMLTSDGQPIPASKTEVMGTAINWGDSTTDGSDPGDVMCPTKTGPLVPLAQTMPLTHTYAKAGTYTVLFTVGACKPLLEVTKTLAVTVR